MTYTDPAGLRSYLNPLADPDAVTAASLSDQALQDCINSAQAEVDAKLFHRYATPFIAPYPMMIVEIVNDIAAFLADSKYRRQLDYSAATVEPMVMRYQRAQQLLMELHHGTTFLPDATPRPTVQNGVPKIINPNDGEMFSLDDFDLGYGTGGTRRNITHPYSPWG